MGDTDTAPIWKKIYQVLSGQNKNVTADVVEDVLRLCREKLVLVLLEYKPYTIESFDSWREEAGLAELVADEEMCTFVHILGRDLDLDVNVAWTVVCNYFMFEYYGKIDELKTVIRYSLEIRSLIDSIWNFYSSDRMFLLKTLRNIFERVSDREDAFYEQFDNFIKSIDINLLWKNLVTVFENLINEIDRDKASVVLHNTLVRWIHRNNREQREVAMLLIHALQYYEVDGSELEHILDLFLKHGFTRHPLYQEATTISKPKDLNEIKCAEIGCVLTITERYWSNFQICKPLSKSMENKLELFQNQGDNSIIFLIWIVLKTGFSTFNTSDEEFNYCNSRICDLINKKVFDSLYQLLIHPMFSNCNCGNIVVQGIYRLMSEFVKVCADYAHLHNQPGVCRLTAELLVRKGLVVLDSMEPIFKLSLEAFPFVFNPFLEMCKSLISIPEKYDYIMQLLRRIPGFLSEVPWNDCRERFNLVGTRNLFIDSDLFIIPEGTIVERFRYQGNDYARFMHPFSFFLLMEQFTKSLSIIAFEVGKDWYGYENLMELVLLGFKFILHVLKHYRGNFREDTVLRSLIQRLEIVPTQFCEGPAKNFDFIKLYFETNCTLVMYNLMDFAEVFPPLIRRKFLPHIGAQKMTHKQMFKLLSSNDSILLKSLKEEESMSDHSLLLMYINLIDNMINKNIYYREVQIPGMWYLLNVAFPLHQQWSYKDIHQMTAITKCMTIIFINILQMQLVDENDISYDVFRICRDSFMYEEVVIASYVSIFIKEKNYIQHLMENESNWIHGPVLEYIDNIRLQLVLLLLLFKLWTDLPEPDLPDTECTIDDKITIISKAVSSYVINPYSTSLRVLSCKFLEVVARDEDIPLMALLELDYDQIQKLFLDKLRDPLEDDDLKINILNLISTCIFFQHGMTAAFFNVNRSRKWYSDNREEDIEADTVSDFMIDYLENIRKSHEYLRSPLQIGILHVMANLWVSGKQHLIQNVVSLEDFWALLADPLYQNYDKEPAVYVFILKIFSTQLAERERDPRFISCVQKFLSDEEKLVLWQEYILGVFKAAKYEEKQIEERDFLMQAWLELLLAIQNIPELNKFSKETKCFFVESCLDGVQLGLADVHNLQVWMDLCLLYITSWGLHFGRKDPDIASKVQDMYNIIRFHYSSLTRDTRAAALTIAQRVLKDLQNHFEIWTKELEEFLEQLGEIIEYEYLAFQEVFWRERYENIPVERDEMVPWLLCLGTCNDLLQFDSVDELSQWFGYHEYLLKIMKCICNLLSINEVLPLAKLALRSLLLYIESPLAYDFVNMDMTRFYDDIEIPLNALLTGRSDRINPADLEEGWSSCTLLMKFNQVFLSEFQTAALPIFYSFTTIYRQILHHIFTIPESTVALKALNLLIHTLIFFDSVLINWKLEWYRRSYDTYKFVMEGIQKLINSCLYTVLRPKNIAVYMFDNHYKLKQMDKVPVDLMVIIMNKLITAVGFGFSILYQTNPCLSDLMGVEVPDTSIVLINNDFSVPKFELPIPSIFTYGKILCLAHFLTKTLDALSVHWKKGRVKVGTPKKFYSKYIGLVEPQDPSENLPKQKLCAFLRYSMYEYSGLADPWIQKLDYLHVKRTLELLMIFLAQQVFLSLKVIDSDNVQYYARNICSELQFFFEYVKKIASMLHNQQESTPSTSTQTPPRPLHSYKSELDVVKKYLLFSLEKGYINDIADENVFLAISHWFTDVCLIN